jgi:hypothetical protein
MVNQVLKVPPKQSLEHIFVPKPELGNEIWPSNLSLDNTLLFEEGQGSSVRQAICGQ